MSQPNTYVTPDRQPKVTAPEELRRENEMLRPAENRLVPETSGSLYSHDALRAAGFNVRDYDISIPVELYLQDGSRYVVVREKTHLPSPDFGAPRRNGVRLSEASFTLYAIERSGQVSNDHHANVGGSEVVRVGLSGKLYPAYDMSGRPLPTPSEPTVELLIVVGGNIKISNFTPEAVLISTIKAVQDAAEGRSREGDVITAKTVEQRFDDVKDVARAADMTDGAVSGIAPGSVDLGLDGQAPDGGQEINEAATGSAAEAAVADVAQVIEQLELVEGDPDRADALIRHYVKDDNVDVLVKALGSSRVSTWVATKVVDGLLAHGKQSLVLDNFSQLVKAGVDPGRIFERIGRDYFSGADNGEGLAAFIRKNLAAFRDLGVRSALSRELHATVQFADDEETLGIPTYNKANDAVYIRGADGKLYIYQIRSAESQAIRIAHSQKEFETPVTETSEDTIRKLFAPVGHAYDTQLIDNAARVLVETFWQDDGFRAIVREHMNKNKMVKDVDPRRVVQELRIKTELRAAVGRYFIRKINGIVMADPGRLPDRLAQNSEKQIDVKGYPARKATSREYAAMLAVAMLDGSFDANRIIPTDEIRVEKGKVINGEHRAAALIALGRGLDTLARS